jgi:putative restriction endonuclease
MSIKLVVAVTDTDWFEMLRKQPGLTEVNFWAPSAANFKALQPGELFLFKLHSPRNFIVGGGIFAYANALPCSLAWEAFDEANGARSATEMRARIAKYRKAEVGDRSDFAVGCRILTQPFFFEEANWIPVPPSWAANIVSFKTYDTSTVDGLALWNAVGERMAATPAPVLTEADRFGKPHLVTPRLGQGAFRVMVTDNYSRRCAVTGERTLPALEAAHIRPYSDGGEHVAHNGLLLRRDLHSLFDSGYVTITPDLKFEVSRKIKEEFNNGKHYYALHGEKIVVPANVSLRPDPGALQWHNEHRYQG